MVALIRAPRGRWLSILRWLAGALIAVVGWQWGSGLDLHEWLYPFFFVMGMLTTWVIGSRWGWLVMPGYLLLGGGFAIANAIRGPLGWFYHSNLVAAILGQPETLWITVFFAVVAAIGGLCAWVMRVLFRRIRLTSLG